LLMHWLHNSSPRARNSGLPMVKLQAKFYWWQAKIHRWQGISLGHILLGLPTK
jgi:hypothetical protein